MRAGRAGRHAVRCALGVALGLSLALSGAAAEEPARGRLFRFEFDNDGFLGSDDGFSAGWSFQLHGAVRDRWDESLPAWIAAVPGLEDDGDGGRVVRWAVGLSQIVVTPYDVEKPEPQPDDLPWAGSVGIHGTLAAYDDLRLVGVQLYLGCLGPCSRVEQIQKFIHHDLGWGRRLAGWDHQLAQRWLANLNVTGSRKLWSTPPEHHGSEHFAADLAISGQVGAGNLATFAQEQIELRFGRGVPRGFVRLPDPPGVGIAIDPVFVPTGLHDAVNAPGWSAYGSLVVRFRQVDRLVFADGGRTRSGYRHPAADFSLDEPVIIAGLHGGRGRMGVHATYYRYVSGRQQLGMKSTLDWVNLSFDLRF